MLVSCSVLGSNAGFNAAVVMTGEVWGATQCCNLVNTLSHT